MLRHFINPFPGQPEILVSDVGRCIYCGRRDLALTDEHIIPEAIGGKLRLDNASCHGAMKNTHSFEGQACADIFNQARKQMGIKGKRRRRSPEARLLPIIESFSPAPETAPQRLVDPSNHPSMLMLPILEPPKRMGGDLMRQIVDGFQMPFDIWNLAANHQERIDRLKSQGFQGVKMYSEVRVSPFLQLIAKISHAAAVATYGYDGFEHALKRIVRGDLTDALELVGGSPNHLDLLPFDYPKGLHQVSVGTLPIGGQPHAIVQIRFFLNLFRGEFMYLTRTYTGIAGKLV